MEDSAVKVSPKVFRALQTVDVESLSKCSDTELRPVLAVLVRMSLIAPLDRPQAQRRTAAILKVLSRIELVNNLVALLSIDLPVLEADVRKEIALRSKVGNAAGDSVLVSNLTPGLGPELEFERSGWTRKVRLVISELVAVMAQVQTANVAMAGSDMMGVPVKIRPSEMFDHHVYLSDVCDVLAIAMAELPNLLSPPEVAEALLRLKFGPEIICHVVANQPESFSEVAFHLLRNGERQESIEGGGCNRKKALLMLCEMDPSQILPIRSRCVELCRMPSLAVALTLMQSAATDTGDVVAFVSGLLLGADQQVRTWFSQFVRNGQKKRSETLIRFRSTLLQRLAQLIIAMRQPTVSADVVIKSTAVLRLYTALRGIAGLKLTDEEITCLVDLITSHPPASAAASKFLSLGLCMLIACSSLTTSSQTLEKRVVEWIRWLVQEESSFDKRRKSGEGSEGGSFAEMLLLMAIHFHSNQTNAIGDLVCQTLGMKIAIRTNSTSKIRHIFTHEVFTDQVVASHAIRVPVTRDLNANFTGFLPVHCIHQLLKSRAFSKHKVPIKDWIFRQICQATTPLHPVVPALIEVFVNSVLVPAASRSSTAAAAAGALIDQTNEPISEQEIREVFRRAVFVDRASSKSSSRESTPLKLWSRATPSSSRAASPLFFNNASSVAAAGPTSVGGGGDHSITTQILVLYYVLLYESVRLNHMRNILTANRKVLRYSHELFADLPIKFLLQTAEREQEKYGCVFPQLLRHCTTHFPHLCMVQDWLMSDDILLSSTVTSSSSSSSLSAAGVGSGSDVTEVQIRDALINLKKCPSKLTLVLRRLQGVPPQDTWNHADTIFGHLKDILDPNTPLQIQELMGKVWFRFNTVFPRKLWAITANHLNHVNGEFHVRKRITQDDLILDPLQVLRCDKRVFQCAPILEILLYMVRGCLAASRTHLTRHIQDNPIVDRPGGGGGAGGGSYVTNDMERDELKNALIATQESAAVQIILEAGLAGAAAAAVGGGGNRHNVKEVKLICSFLHDSFIADPNLAKLVHFQGYPLELLAITVGGVPSMHICLDFAPELLSQPDLEKQAFAIDLISHLSVQYALPKSYSIARLAVNTLSTLLSVMSAEERVALFEPTLPSMVRFCKAFPPLIEDVVGLMLQYGRVCISEACVIQESDDAGGCSGVHSGTVFGGESVAAGASPRSVVGGNSSLDLEEDLKSILAREDSAMALASKIQAVFRAILSNSVLEKRTY